MIWFVLPVVLAIFLGFKYRNTYMGAGNGVIMGLFAGAILGGLALVASSALAFFVFNVETPPMKYEGRSNILSLEDSSSTEGNFFLGSGSVKEKPVFWYYEDSGDYSTLEYQYAYKSRIIEGDIDQPHVKYYEEGVDWRWLYFAATGQPDYVEFHVPKDTIVTNYNLDAKP